MTSTEVRSAFLEFFKGKQHEIVSSAPIVVKNDPTLMFTNAGMNQFKDYFLGHKTAPNTRIADTQKCLRVSGKHNDLEEVGVDTYHHTMFEMLGNWSFGDYFKKEAIAWAWALLTEVYKLDKNRLYVTVFEGDQTDGLDADVESEQIWQQFIDPERILRCNKKDNFWEMGDTGPCGACSEIHMDLRSDAERHIMDGKALVNADHPQVIELWNLVFMEFNRKADGSLEGLPAKHVDTGMGLERVVRAIQLHNSNYDTDLFLVTIKELEALSGKKYGVTEEIDIAFRVIADHIRALAFCIADGQLPSNNGAGYVIRRILRRAVRYGYSFLGFDKPFLNLLIPGLSQRFKDIFPELYKQREFVLSAIKSEEKTFFNTLVIGMLKLDRLIGDNVVTNIQTYFELQNIQVVKSRISDFSNVVNDNNILGIDDELRNGLRNEALYISELKIGILFSSTQNEIKVNSVIRNVKLSDVNTPINAFIWSSEKKAYKDVSLKEMLSKQFEIISSNSKFDYPVKHVDGEFAFELYDTFGFPLDLTRLIAGEKGIGLDEVGFTQQLDVQKKRSKADAVKTTGDWVVLSEDSQQEFIGYDHLQADIEIARYRSLEAKGQKKFQMVFNFTPFYGESGGQVGDTGILIGSENQEVVKVIDAQKENNLIVHIVDKLPENTNQIFHAQVHVKRRDDITKNHSATHLMHSALRQVLGEHVAQKGSLVDDQKLRFDFSHFEKPTDDQISTIEDIVNAKIKEGIELWEDRSMPYNNAIAKGVTALFGEKYGDVVRVVVFDDEFSMELCGGTHVSNTTKIGGFKLMAESSVAAGVRRIEAITGDGLERYVNQQMSLLEQIAQKLNHPADLLKQLDQLLISNDILTKQLAEFSRQQIQNLVRELSQKITNTNGVNVLIEEVHGVDSGNVKDLAFQLRQTHPNLFLVLASSFEGKPGISIIISDALVNDKGWNAGALVREWGRLIKGGGGGQPFFAQAGGSDVDGLGEVVKVAKAFVESQ